MQGVSVRTFSNMLYRKMWEHFVKTALKMKYGYNDVAIMNSLWYLNQPTGVLLSEKSQFLMMMSSECIQVI